MSSPASAADGYRGVVVRGAAVVTDLAPPPLDLIGPDLMLAVAPVPGRLLEQWRHAALGCWIAWPHAAAAVHAEEMTAAQLRDLLAARDNG